MSQPQLPAAQNKRVCCGIVRRVPWVLHVLCAKHRMRINQADLLHMPQIRSWLLRSRLKLAVKYAAPVVAQSCELYFFQLMVLHPRCWSGLQYSARLLSQKPLTSDQQTSMSISLSCHRQATSNLHASTMQMPVG